MMVVEMEREFQQHPSYLHSYNTTDHIRFMVQKEDIIHVLIQVIILLGFVLFITSLRGIEGIPNTTFILGLLLFTIGTYQYGYRRGYGVGEVSGYNLGKTSAAPQE